MGTDRVLTPSSDYGEKLNKLIPAEVVGTYLAIAGLASAAPQRTEFWILVISILVLVILMPLYLRRLSGVTGVQQTLVTMGSFVIWVASTGGPLLSYDWYSKLYGAVALILWTMAMPLFTYQQNKARANS
jgi:hypothetical protein